MAFKVGKPKDPHSNSNSASASTPGAAVASQPSADSSHAQPLLSSSSPPAPEPVIAETSSTSVDMSERSKLRDDDRDAKAQGVDAENAASPAAETSAAAEPPVGVIRETVNFHPHTYSFVDKNEADRIAREAVHAELERQADKARYDVSEGNRVVLVLDEASLRTYTADWTTHNLTANEKLNFTQYLTNRLRACQSHTSTRPIYVDDTTRQSIEALFSEAVTSADDLRNKIDRHIRPIIESEDLPDGVLRFKPLDPAFIEMVSGWEPDKTVAEAVSDFMTEAAYQKAGIL